MPRNISFALTTAQIRNRTKTVTRRFAWWKLQPGTILQAVERSQGLKKGERVVKLCLIRVVSVRVEPLWHITEEDCVREGFPEMTPYDFVTMLAKKNNLETLEKRVNRIEFEYV